MLPLWSARLLGVMMHGQVNVTEPKLSTVPLIVPSVLEITPFLIVTKRGMVLELPLVRLVGNV